MDNFVMYRLPGEHEYTCLEQTEGMPVVIPSIEALHGKEGFVFAPFQVDGDCPILLLKANKKSVFSVPPGEYKNRDFSDKSVQNDDLGDDTNRNRYGREFRCFHKQLVEGNFKKIVLARKSKVKTDRKFNEKELFLEACRCYPRQFVALVHFIHAGVWLMATPEILLEGNRHEWTTMALAGTMQMDKTANCPQRFQDKSPLSAFWSSKNIEEQEYVTSYINRVLQPLVEEIIVEGPCTTRVGGLLHLRTNFRFRLLSQTDVTTLLKRLFPTPAVCGIPKESSKEFILQHEHNSRRYYSGFSGLISPEGDTRLYVTLRCMEIKNGFCELYAGSGLMPESKEENEYQETKAKMQPMLALIKK